MSQKRKQKQAKQVKRKNQRAQHAPKRPPSIEQVAYEIVAGAAEPLLGDDPVDAEIVASEVMASVHAQRVGMTAEQLEAVPSAAVSVIALLRDAFSGEGEVLDAALALTLALWSMAPADLELAGEAAQLAERLRGSGAQDPVWASDIGTYEITECWLLRDVWCGQQDIVIGFRDTRGMEHSVSVLCLQDAGFQIAEINVSVPIGEFVQRVTSSLATDPAREMTVLERIDSKRACGLVGTALDATRTEGAEALLESDMGIDHVGLLESRWARLAELPRVDIWETAPLRTELDDLELHDLERRLWNSPEREAEPGATRAAADELAAWVVHAGVAVWFAQFGPDQAEEFLLDDAAPAAFGATDLEERITSTLAAARAWARLTNAAARLPDAALTATLQCIDELAEPFAAIARGDEGETDVEEPADADVVEGEPTR